MTLTQTVLGLVVAGTMLAAWSIPVVAVAMALQESPGPIGPSITEEQSGNQNIF